MKNIFLTTIILNFLLNSAFAVETPGFLMDIRDKHNVHKCFGTLISSKMVLAPASCIERDEPTDLIIMTGDQRNLTSVYNLPDIYYERLIKWYDDQCNNNLSLSLTTILQYMDQIERLNKTSNRESHKEISVQSVRTVQKIIKHPFYSSNDDIFNIASLELSSAVSIDQYLDQLDINLAYNIPKSLKYRLASYEKINSGYFLLSNDECEAAFSAKYSNKTHFCVKSANDASTEFFGMPILNEGQMFGQVLDQKLPENVLLVLNTAKFVPFVQSVESGKDFEDKKDEIHRITKDFAAKIIEQMAFI